MSGFLRGPFVPPGWENGHKHPSYSFGSFTLQSRVMTFASLLFFTPVGSAYCRTSRWLHSKGTKSSRRLEIPQAKGRCVEYSAPHVPVHSITRSVEIRKNLFGRSAGLQYIYFCKATITLLYNLQSFASSALSVPHDNVLC